MGGIPPPGLVGGRSLFLKTPLGVSFFGLSDLGFVGVAVIAVVFFISFCWFLYQSYLCIVIR